MRRLLLLFVLSTPLLTIAQSPWATSVVDYQFGTTQTHGQSPDVFPDNVLGPVTAVVSEQAPANTEDEVVSLGRDGWITLAFDAPIEDWPGPDFTVFENPFFYGNNFVFDEWLKVEVSIDGSTFVAFPHDTLTGAGMAGRTPTQSGAPTANDPATAGGDAFDLAELGLDSVRYIRLTDMTRHQPPDRLGAEVDAVRVWRPGVVSRAELAAEVQIRHAANGVTIASDSPISELRLLDLQGRVVREQRPAPARSHTLMRAGLVSGVYVLQLQTAAGLITQRVLIQ